MERITRLSFAIAAIIVMATSLFLYSALSRASQSSQRLYQTYEVLDIVHQIREDYLGAELTVRNYALTKVPAELIKNAQLLAQIRANIGALESLLKESPDSQQKLQQLAGIYATISPVLDASSQAQSINNAAWSDARLPLEQDRVNFFQSANDLESEELRVFKDLGNTAQDRFRATVLTLAAIAAIGLLLLVLAYSNLVVQMRARRQAVQQKNQSSALLHLTVDSVDGMIIYVDRDRRYQFASKAYTELFGRGKESIVGATMEETLGRALYAQVTELIDQVLSGKTVHAERRRMLNDGRQIDLRLSLEPNRDDTGEIQGFFGQIIDITEFRRKEALLLETTTFQKAILDSAHISIISTDRDGIIRTFNVGAQRMLGYSAEELVGAATPARLHDPEECRQRARALSCELGEAIDPESEVFLAKAKRSHADEGEWTYIRKDGSRLPVFLSITALRAREDEIIGYLGIAFDITRQKETEAQLQQARTEAEAASRAKSAFLATMSHEIRTPMNGVLGVAEVLARTRLAEHQADMVQTIRESAEVLLNLIDDILDFSKIEAGRLELEMAPVSIRDLAEGICTSLLPVAAAKNVDLDLFVSPMIPERVMWDDVRLRQVLYNLLGNAIKFSAGQPRRRGRVRLHAEVAQAAPLQIVFRVIDNGIGIAPEALGQLFTSFTQAETSTTRRFGGTGLGLAICKRLVELAKGKITVDSTPGAGSTFTVVLPFELADAQPSPALADLTGLECIVVESGQGTAADLSPYLVAQGAHAQIAGNLADAARLAADVASQVVIVHDNRDMHLTEHALQEAFAAAPNGRHLLLAYGSRRQVRIETTDAVSLDANILLRKSFLCAVAVAAGRATPEDCQDQSSKRQVMEFAPPSIAAARAQGRLILVAEDDAINQKVILRQLGLLGYAAEIANNGADALVLWRNGRYALLLTDLHMPEMDGYGLARAIRAEESMGHRLPILALTADALRGESRRATAAGIDDYLTKPVSLDKLHRALEKWMPPNDATAVAATPPGARGAAADAPAFDVAVLKALVGADDAAVRELLATYLANARQQAAELRNAIETDDIGLAGDIAHKLKSSSRAVGALPLGDACAELETAARAANKAAVQVGLPGFDAALAAADMAIAAMLTEKNKKIRENKP